MATSGITTLFGEPSRSSWHPSSFAISVLLHAGFFSLVTFHWMQTHRIIERFPVDRFAVRYVDFHSKEPETRQAAGSSIRYPGQAAAAKADLAPAAKKLTPSAEGGSTPGSPAISRMTPRRMPAPQTVIQPDIAHMLTLPQKTTVPLVVLWTPDKTTVKKVVPALPDKPSIAVVHPSLDVPIKEENLADLRLSSSAFVTQGPAAPPSTTSPIVVHGPEEAKKAPQTSSKQPEPPTPGRVISLSDLRVAEGKVAVPMANQTASAAPGTMIPGQLKDPAPAGNGVSNSKAAGSGAGKGSGDRAGSKDDTPAKSGTAADRSGTGDQAAKTAKGDPGAAADRGAKTPAAGNSGSPSPSKSAPSAVAAGPASNLRQSGAAAGPAQGAAAGGGATESISTVHISLPKDGQFGVVVFGASIQERYPETAEMWSGRMASTVYLHVGMAKNWILQYALPRLTEAAGGGHIDAPWPYEIARPNLDPGDLNADALILHGYVNQIGRFEKLEVVFPTQLPQANAIVGVLNHWQFRPAHLNGQATAVEVLLIIPDQSE